MVNTRILRDQGSILVEKECVKLTGCLWWWEDRGMAGSHWVFPDVGRHSNHVDNGHSAHLQCCVGSSAQSISQIQWHHHGNKSQDNVIWKDDWGTYPACARDGVAVVGVTKAVAGHTGTQQPPWLYALEAWRTLLQHTHTHQSRTLLCVTCMRSILVQRGCYLLVAHLTGGASVAGGTAAGLHQDSPAHPCVLLRRGGHLQVADADLLLVGVIARLDEHVLQVLEHHHDVLALGPPEARLIHRPGTLHQGHLHLLLHPSKGLQELAVVDAPPIALNTHTQTAVTNCGFCLLNV